MTVIETKKREEKLGIERCKKGESDKSVREEKEKRVEENGDFIRPETTEKREEKKKKNGREQKQKPE